MHTAVIAHQKVSTIVDNVNQALADIERAFALLDGAKARLHATLGRDYHYYDSLWSGTISDYNLKSSGESSVQHVTKNAWRYIVQKMGIMAYMTEARANQLKDQIQKSDLPELTVDNIMSTMQALAGRTPELLQEAIREVFTWLRPRSDYGVGKLKTNKKFRIGPKVIIGGAVRRYWKGEAFHLNYEDHFRILGNVFSLLDGQGVERYPDDLKTRLNTGFQEASTVEDQYFTCTAYANGNLHVTFKRRDLVDDINRIAGGMAIGEEE